MGKLWEALGMVLAQTPELCHIIESCDWRRSDFADAPGCRTMAVRPKGEQGFDCLYYGPFVLGTPMAQLCSAITHEIAHVGLLHHCRRGGRDPFVWNLAADMSVNGPGDDSTVAFGGQVLPGLVYLPRGWPRGELVEEYYRMLLEHPDSPPGACGICERPCVHRPGRAARARAAAVPDSCPLRRMDVLATVGCVGFPRAGLGARS